MAPCVRLRPPWLRLVLGLCELSRILLGTLVGVWSLNASFDEVTAGFGTTHILAGIHHKNTTNPDGSPINFWTQGSEGALAVETGLSNPHIAAADAFGNVYVADKSSHSILKITPEGTIHTFAGTHVAGFNGDGPAPATSLQIQSPNGLFVMPNGVVYLLDPGNHRIRRVDLHGIMTTVVKDETPRWYPSGRALWVSPDQQLIYYTHEFAPLVIDGVTNQSTDGATVKRWTSTRGIETVCSQQVGFRNPGNLAVNPVDGLLYVCDRAEDDNTKLATGLFRIDGDERRTRMTGNVDEAPPADGQLALHSFIEGPRGIAFRPDGSYFLCAHRDGSVWYIDTQGILHQYLRGRGNKDTFNLTDGLHPPLTDQDYFSQPRAVTLAPNGDLVVVSNDSGFVFRVRNIVPAPMPLDLRLSVHDLDVHLDWSGNFGQGYRVQRSSPSPALQWTTIGAVGGSGTASPTEFIDRNSATDPSLFYRLVPAL